eukprot:evm.model.scf_1235.2 EVM.evm.TU.scf_1235.2   scf_1235:11728-13574(-)
MVMKDVGKLSRELLRSHAGGYRMEELPGRRSEGDKSFSTQHESAEPGHCKPPTGRRIPASKRGYQQLASLWTDLWCAPAGGSGDRPQGRSRSRRPTGSEMERLEVIWDATWEARACGPPHAPDPPTERESFDDRGLDSAMDWDAGNGESHMSPWDAGLWATGARTGSGSAGGGIRGQGCAELPPVLYELPGFRSGDGESWMRSEGTSEGGGVEAEEGGEGAGLDALERRMEERWTGAGRACGDAESPVASQQPERSLSLVDRLMSALSRSTRGRKMRAEKFEVSDEFKNFTDHAMPSFPPGYIDPRASARSI